ncbi:MAG: hypothetical protein ROO76_15360 [Terriglobia bacterium]|nr:hypothetical protein [Terriglobia bacterium]
MKIYVALGVILLASSFTLAQSTQSQQTGDQSKGMSPNMQMGSTQKSQGMQGMKDHMQEMQAEIQQMKSRVEKMRSDAEKVQDANTKAALLDNADMWDQFMNHMQSHMGMMMKEGMHHGDMKGHGMMHDKNAPSSKPSQSTTPNPQ